MIFTQQWNTCLTTTLAGISERLIPTTYKISIQGHILLSTAITDQDTDLKEKK
jgi:hypothetical protein